MTNLQITCASMHARVRMQRTLFNQSPIGLVPGIFDDPIIT